jgi:hypothetical protein
MVEKDKQRMNKKPAPAKQEREEKGSQATPVRIRTYDLSRLQPDRYR